MHSPRTIHMTLTLAACRFPEADLHIAVKVVAGSMGIAIRSCISEDSCKFDCALTPEQAAELADTGALTSGYGRFV